MQWDRFFYMGTQFLAYWGPSLAKMGKKGFIFDNDRKKQIC